MGGGGGGGEIERRVIQRAEILVDLPQSCSAVKLA